jgi:hypothetical protein
MIAANREIERLAGKPGLTGAEQDRLKRLRRAKAERERIRAAFPKEFDDGARRAFTRDSLYPPGFLKWSLDQRNAWFAGFNVGLSDRTHAAIAETVDG